MSYDIIIIGGGPGGYVAAIRAAQNGLNVACINNDSGLGGTCLQRGCIPSKTLLESSHQYYMAVHKMKNHGIILSDIKLDFQAMMLNKKKIINELNSGIESLFKKHKITHIKGDASFVSKNEVIVNGDKISAKSFIIATGSLPSVLHNIKIDEKHILSSTGALSLDVIPEKLCIVGGGYIGLELGMMYYNLGVKVEIIEFADRILSTMDIEISNEFQKIIDKFGIPVHLSTKVKSAKSVNNLVSLEIENIKTGVTSQINSSHVLFAVGRSPNVNGLNCDKADVILNNHGFITVNDHYRTSNNSIYAIGDVIGGPMLAHKASEEGVFVADIIAGKKPHAIDYNLIPGVVYTHPEIASIGKTEEQLIKDGVKYKKGKFSFMANSRAKAVSDIYGFVKILSCASTDQVLGCHIIGKDAGTIIHEVAVLMAFSGSAEDLALICHAHPTLNEAVKEAALAVEGLQIHS